MQPVRLASGFGRLVAAIETGTGPEQQLEQASQSGKIGRFRLQAFAGWRSPSAPGGCQYDPAQPGEEV